MNKKLKKKGSSFGIVAALFLIIVGGSTLLTGGVFPKLTNSVPANQNQENIPVLPTASGGNNSLQLKTFGFRQKQCTQTLAVDFLVDNSGSMGFGSKLSEVQKGMIRFASGFSDNTDIGVQKFSTTPQSVIPLSYYKDVKSQFSRYVNSMTASGPTYTKDAFSFTKTKLDAGIPKYPGYKLALIFVSDGVPETFSGDAACVPAYCRANSCECFAPEQDPTSVANQMKQEGIRIFTIAYVDKSDAKINSLLQNLMRNVASSPSDLYSAPDSSQISSILTQIANKLCE